MSMDSETRLRRALMRLSNERTESGVKAALALALWDGVDVPQDVRDVIDSMDGQVVDESLKPESTEGRPWGQSLKKPSGAPLNLG